MQAQIKILKEKNPNTSGSDLIKYFNEAGYSPFALAELEQQVQVQTIADQTQRQIQGMITRATNKGSLDKEKFRKQLEAQGFAPEDIDGAFEKGVLKMESIASNVKQQLDYQAKYGGQKISDAQQRAKMRDTLKGYGFSDSEIEEEVGDQFGPKASFGPSPEDERAEVANNLLKELQKSTKGQKALTNQEIQLAMFEAGFSFAEAGQAMQKNYLKSVRDDAERKAEQKALSGVLKSEEDKQAFIRETIKKQLLASAKALLDSGKITQKEFAEKEKEAGETIDDMGLDISFGREASLGLNSEELKARKDKAKGETKGADSRHRENANKAGGEFRTKTSMETSNGDSVIAIDSETGVYGVLVSDPAKAKGDLQFMTVLRDNTGAEYTGAYEKDPASGAYFKKGTTELLDVDQVAYIRIEVASLESISEGNFEDLPLSEQAIIVAQQRKNLADAIKQNTGVELKVLDPGFYINGVKQTSIRSTEVVGNLPAGLFNSLANGELPINLMSHIDKISDPIIRATILAALGPDGITATSMNDALQGIKSQGIKYDENSGTLSRDIGALVDPSAIKLSMTVEDYNLVQKKFDDIAKAREREITAKREATPAGTIFIEPPFNTVDFFQGLKQQYGVDFTRNDQGQIVPKGLNFATAGGEIVFVDSSKIVQNFDGKEYLDTVKIRNTEIGLENILEIDKQIASLGNKPGDQEKKAGFIVQKGLIQASLVEDTNPGQQGKKTSDALLQTTKDALASLGIDSSRLGELMNKFATNRRKQEAVKLPDRFDQNTYIGALEADFAQKEIDALFNSVSGASPELRKTLEGLRKNLEDTAVGNSDRLARIDVAKKMTGMLTVQYGEDFKPDIQKTAALQVLFEQNGLLPEEARMMAIAQQGVAIREDKAYTGQSNIPDIKNILEYHLKDNKGNLPVEIRIMYADLIAKQQSEQTLNEEKFANLLREQKGANAEIRDVAFKLDKDITDIDSRRSAFSANKIVEFSDQSMNAFGNLFRYFGSTLGISSSTGDVEYVGSDTTKLERSTDKSIFDQVNKLRANSLNEPPIKFTSLAEAQSALNRMNDKLLQEQMRVSKQLYIKTSLEGKSPFEVQEFLKAEEKWNERELFEGAANDILLEEGLTLKNEAEVRSNLKLAYGAGLTSDEIVTRDTEVEARITALKQGKNLLANAVVSLFIPDTYTGTKPKKQKQVDEQRNENYQRYRINRDETLKVMARINPSLIDSILKDSFDESVGIAA
ncbi:MAG: hypothetical protein Q7K43_06350, partial [Candidatus Woesearchaeota archaeon]|nr:hypothetical protein [Candidatus Woesearchaeota archaeon]